MRFEYENGELDILDETLPDDDNSMLNYTKTLGGHCILIDQRFELVPLEHTKGMYLIKRKK